jgi:hypothetical protein
MRAMRRPLSLKDRFAVLVAGGFRCTYCGKRPAASELEVDHVVPVAKGGTNDPRNLVVSCSDCNLGKSSVRLDADAAWRPVRGESPGRCSGDVHDAPWSEYPIGPPDESIRELAMVCTACGHIVAVKTLWRR